MIPRSGNKTTKNVTFAYDVDEFGEEKFAGTKRTVHDDQSPSEVTQDQKKPFVHPSFWGHQKRSRGWKFLLDHARKFKDAKYDRQTTKMMIRKRLEDDYLCTKQRFSLPLTFVGFWVDG